MTRAEPLTVHTLGTPRVMAGERVLDVQGKSLALLVYVAVEGETSREALADLLWTDLGADAARRNLRVQLHRLKASEAGAWLHASGPTVAVHPDVRVDVLRLRAALADGDHERAAALAGGRFLDHLLLPAAAAFDGWAEAYAASIREEQYRALDLHAEALAVAGQLAAALAVRERAVRLDPLRERSVRALMETLLALGRHDAALDTFDALSRALHADLGVRPLPATLALRDRIEHAREGAHAGRPADAEPTSPLPMPLVGREDARTALLGSRLRLVLGEAGVGKSRLVHDAAGSAALILRGAPETTPLPFGPLLDVLRAGALAHCPLHLRPLLHAAVHEPGAAQGPDTRGSLLDAFAQALVSLLGPRTLIVEDLHWLDSGTLEAVFLALHRGAPRVWLTARPGELNARTELTDILRRLNPPRVTLHELSEQDVAALITRLTGAPAPLFSRRLYAATAGHPLFLVETLRGLRERGELNVQGGHWFTPHDAYTVDYAEMPIPPGVTEAIAERVERLGSATRQLLQAGTLWGESFPIPLVAGACGLDEREALDALERAELARLIVPEGSGYRFGHDLYRRVVARTLGEPRARYLHRQLAQLAPPGTPPAKLADHYQHAGEPGLAWPHWRDAAQAAERLYAYADALDASGRALAAGPPPADAFHLHAARSELQRHTDDPVGRTESLEHMAALARVLDDPALHADLAARRAKFHTEEDEYELAVQTVQRALDGLAPLSDDHRAALLLEGGAARACQERWDDARSMLEPALELTRRAQPVRASNILYWLGYAAFRSGDYVQAAAQYGQSVAAHPGSHATRGRTLSLWKYGACLRRLGQHHEAAAVLADAERHAQVLTTPSIRGLIVAEQAALALDQGERDAARVLAAEAQGLLTPKGDEGWDVLRPVLAAVGLTPSG
ncbi:DNA-binding SARP family transcriptional activator [Deinococcus metalli]|uniref:DNA-binding SARP family transcriptional activator n=1 Tax=Deinococcus metalli TaxID=1141878 RepID=A0A7W8NNY7_9DEIO|nr:BTAD domain-containing putative transcriptional regulator [Deinococcus metalli]MBB5375200.1 DNA-binding SARP family transcriptional activator [Deinococcus metalli]GHF31020.1 hypothetical protein GCM10017781_03970 [Deinococcus metalli]